MPPFFPFRGPANDPSKDPGQQPANGANKLPPNLGAKEWNEKKRQLLERERDRLWNESFPVRDFYAAQTIEDKQRYIGDPEVQKFGEITDMLENWQDVNKGAMVKGVWTLNKTNNSLQQRSNVLQPLKLNYIQKRIEGREGYDEFDVGDAERPYKFEFPNGQGQLYNKDQSGPVILEPGTTDPVEGTYMYKEPGSTKWQQMKYVVQKVGQKLRVWADTYFFLVRPDIYERKIPPQPTGKRVQGKNLVYTEPEQPQPRGPNQMPALKSGYDLVDSDKVQESVDSQGYVTAYSVVIDERAPLDIGISDGRIIQLTGNESRNMGNILISRRGSIVTVNIIPDRQRAARLKMQFSQPRKGTLTSSPTPLTPLSKQAPGTDPNGSKTDIHPTLKNAEIYTLERGKTVIVNIDPDLDVLQISHNGEPVGFNDATTLFPGDMEKVLQGAIITRGVDNAGKETGEVKIDASNCKDKDLVIIRLRPSTPLPRRKPPLNQPSALPPQQRGEPPVPPVKPPANPPDPNNPSTPPSNPSRHPDVVRKLEEERLKVVTELGKKVIDYLEKNTNLKDEKWKVINFPGTPLTLESDSARPPVKKVYIEFEKINEQGTSVILKSDTFKGEFGTRFCIFKVDTITEAKQKADEISKDIAEYLVEIEELLEMKDPITDDNLVLDDQTFDISIVDEEDDKKVAFRNKIKKLNPTVRELDPLRDNLLEPSKYHAMTISPTDTIQITRQTPRPRLATTVLISPSQNKQTVMQDVDFTRDPKKPGSITIYSRDDQLIVDRIPYNPSSPPAAPIDPKKLILSEITKDSTQSHTQRQAEIKEVDDLKKAQEEIDIEKAMDEGEVFLQAADRLLAREYSPAELSKLVLKNTRGQFMIGDEQFQIVPHYQNGSEQYYTRKYPKVITRGGFLMQTGWSAKGEIHAFATSASLTTPEEIKNRLVSALKLKDKQTKEKEEETAALQQSILNTVKSNTDFEERYRVKIDPGTRDITLLSKDTSGPTIVIKLGPASSTGRIPVSLYSAAFDRRGDYETLRTRDVGTGTYLPTEGKIIGKEIAKILKPTYLSDTIPSGSGPTLQDIATLHLSDKVVEKITDDFCKEMLKKLPDYVDFGEYEVKGSASSKGITLANDAGNSLIKIVPTIANKQISFECAKYTLKPGKRADAWSDGYTQQMTHSTHTIAIKDITPEKMAKEVAKVLLHNFKPDIAEKEEVPANAPEITTASIIGDLPLANQPGNHSIEVTNDKVTVKKDNAPVVQFRLLTSPRRERGFVEGEKYLQVGGNTVLRGGGEKYRPGDDLIPGRLRAEMIRYLRDVHKPQIIIKTKQEMESEERDRQAAAAEREKGKLLTKEVFEELEKIITATDKPRISFYQAEATILIKHASDATKDPLEFTCNTSKSMTGTGGVNDRADHRLHTPQEIAKKFAEQIKSHTRNTTLYGAGYAFEETPPEKIAREKKEQEAAERNKKTTEELMIALQEQLEGTAVVHEGGNIIKIKPPAPIPGKPALRPIVYICSVTEDGQYSLSFTASANILMSRQMSPDANTPAKKEHEQKKILSLFAGEIIKDLGGYLRAYGLKSKLDATVEGEDRTLKVARAIAQTLENEWKDKLTVDVGNNAIVITDPLTGKSVSYLLVSDTVNNTWYLQIPGQAQKLYANSGELQTKPNPETKLSLAIINSQPIKTLLEENKKQEKLNEEKKLAKDVTTNISKLLDELLVQKGGMITVDNAEKGIITITPQAPRGKIVYSLEVLDAGIILYKQSDAKPKQSVSNYFPQSGARPDVHDAAVQFTHRIINDSRPIRGYGEAAKGPDALSRMGWKTDEEIKGEQKEKEFNELAFKQFTDMMEELLELPMNAYTKNAATQLITIKSPDPSVEPLKIQCKNVGGYYALFVQGQSNFSQRVDDPNKRNETEAATKYLVERLVRGYPNTLRACGVRTKAEAQEEANRQKNNVELAKKTFESLTKLIEDPNNRVKIDGNTISILPSPPVPGQNALVTYRLLFQSQTSYRLNRVESGGKEEERAWKLTDDKDTTSTAKDLQSVSERFADVIIKDRGNGEGNAIGKHALKQYGIATLEEAREARELKIRADINAEVARNLNNKWKMPNGILEFGAKGDHILIYKKDLEKKPQHQDKAAAYRWSSSPLGGANGLSVHLYFRSQADNANEPGRETVNTRNIVTLDCDSEEELKPGDKEREKVMNALEQKIAEKLNLQKKP